MVGTSKAFNDTMFSCWCCCCERGGASGAILPVLTRLVLLLSKWSFVLALASGKWLDVSDSSVSGLGSELALLFVSVSVALALLLR